MFFLEKERHDAVMNWNQPQGGAHDALSRPLATLAFEERFFAFFFSEKKESRLRGDRAEAFLADHDAC